MVDDKKHIIAIAESWANNDIADAKLGLVGYVMFRKDRMGGRGGVLLYVKDTLYQHKKYNYGRRRSIIIRQRYTIPA